MNTTSTTEYETDAEFRARVRTDGSKWSDAAALGIELLSGSALDKFVETISNGHHKRESKARGFTIKQLRTLAMQVKAAPYVSGFTQAHVSISTIKANTIAGALAAYAHLLERDAAKQDEAKAPTVEQLRDLVKIFRYNTNDCHECTGYERGSKFTWLKAAGELEELIEQASK